MWLLEECGRAFLALTMINISGGRWGGEMSNRRGNYILLRKSEVAVEMELCRSTMERRGSTEEMSRGGALTIKTRRKSQVKIGDKVARQ